jgi:hypothetical protein
MCSIWNGPEGPSTPRRKSRSNWWLEFPLGRQSRWRMPKSPDSDVTMLSWVRLGTLPDRRPQPHHLLGAGAAVISLLVFIGALVVHAENHSKLALFLTICVAVGSAVSVAGIAFVRQTITAAIRSDEPEEVLTGRVLSSTSGPRPPAARPLWADGWYWTGGARVPGSLGWLNATWPLAVLEIAPSGVTLRVRTGRVFGAEPLIFAPSSGVRVAPVRRLGTSGLAFRQPHTATSYFWTSSREEILATLDCAGYQVSWAEQMFNRWD